VSPEIHLRSHAEFGDRDFLFKVFAAAGPALELAALPESPVKSMLLAQQFQGWLQSYSSHFRIDGLAIVECPLGERVGFVWLFRNSEEYRIADLAFTPAVRGKGIGTALVQQIAAEAFRAGLPLRASVAKSNAGSHRFNLRLGYVVTHDSLTHWAIEWRPEQA